MNKATIESISETTSTRQNGRLVFKSPGAVAIEPVDVPPTLGKLVRVRSVVSGISHGTEMAWYQGRASALRRRWDQTYRIFDDIPPDHGYPVAPGYETVGRVDAVGPEVDSLAPGDLVYLDRPHATVHVVPLHAAVAVPRDIRPEAAVFFPLSRVALGGIHDAELRIGDAVAVIGVGVVGLLVVALARHAGAGRIVAMDRYPLRLEAAARLGAQTIHVERVAEAARIAHDLLGGIGADVVIDASGAYRGLREAVRCCRVGGRVVTISSYHGQACGLSLGEEYHRNRIELVSSMTINGCPHRQAPRWDLERLDATARTLIETGTLPVEQLVTHRVPFEQAADAYTLVADKPDETIKVVLTYAD